MPEESVNNLFKLSNCCYGNVLKMVKAQATAMSCLGRSLGLQKYLFCGKMYYPFCLFYTQISACGKICLEKAFCPVDTDLIH